MTRLSASEKSWRSRSRPCPQCGRRRDSRATLCKDCAIARRTPTDPLKNIQELGEAYREALQVAADARRELDLEIRRTKAAGVSFARLSKASGLAISTIQEIVR